MNDWTSIVDLSPRWMVATVLWVMVFVGAANLIMHLVRSAMSALLWILGKS